MPEYEANGKYIVLKEKNMVGDYVSLVARGTRSSLKEKETKTIEQFIKDMFKAMQNVGLVYPITQFGRQDKTLQMNSVS